MADVSLQSRKDILAQLGFNRLASRSSWSHDRGDVVVFDAWEHGWERDDDGNLVRYPLRTNGDAYNLEDSRTNPRRGHTRWQNHVNIVLNGERQPLAILPVARNPGSTPNKGARGWLPLVVQGHVEANEEGEIWLHADHVFDLNVQTLDAWNAKFAQAVADATALSSSERAIRLAEAQRFPKRTEVIAYIFERNPNVVAEVLSMAKGRCQRCHQPAPFNRRSDGSPYLEVHHRVPLAMGGEDTVDNAIALCPNCHRHAHYG
jgi:hypothetical protein